MAEKPDRGRVEIYQDECKGCGLCVEFCPAEVLFISEKINKQGYNPAEYTGSGCTGCGTCFYTCPEPGAITVYRLKKTGASVEEKAPAPAGGSG